MPSSRCRATRLSRRRALQAGAASIAAGHVSLAAVRPTFAMQTATPAAADDGISAARVTEAVDALDTIVSDIHSASGVPGIAVAVVHQDDVLATGGYGVTNTEINAQVDTNTIFQIASLSKPIASTVVASIIGDGMLSWDTRIVDHLPDFAMHDPWVTSQVTLRDMFAHRSGLPDHAGDPIEDLGYERDEVLHRLRHQPAGSSFRSTYAYTNFGLTAAAVAASNATGASWEDACTSLLYEPAGMTRTSSRFDDFINDENHASGHVQIDNAWIPMYVRNPDAQSPAGGVSSTATDMARWMRLQLGSGALDGDQLVPPEPLRETHRPQIISNPPADPATDRAGFYGLGWNVSYDDHGAVQLSHSGAFALGAGTAVYLLPADQLGIVVLCNAAANGVSESIALSFLDIARTGAIQNDYFSILSPIFTELLIPEYGADVHNTTPPPNPSPAQPHRAYIGTYANDLYGPVTIDERDGELVILLGPDKTIYPLAHWDRDTFTYLPIGENQNVTSAITFTTGVNGSASHLTIENLDMHDQGTFTRETPPN